MVPNAEGYLHELCGIRCLGSGPIKKLAARTEGCFKGGDAWTSSVMNNLLAGTQWASIASVTPAPSGRPIDVS